ncbi:MAG: TetR/AcrR family transcriptional regulator [Pseudomonadota bacterium]
MARPKEFNPDEALEKAMRAFWAHGYHDTSMRDLVKATGVNQYGLYSTFEDKHGLFLAALDRYRATVTPRISRELSESSSGVKAIRRAFDRILEITRQTEGHSGCLMCITAVEVAPYDKQASSKVSGHLLHLRDAFQIAIERGQAEGEISADKDARTLAEFLTNNVYCVAVMMRAGAEIAYARRHIDTALSALL